MRLGDIAQRRAWPVAIDSPNHGHAFRSIRVEYMLDNKVAPA